MSATNAKTTTAELRRDEQAIVGVPYFANEYKANDKGITWVQLSPFGSFNNVQGKQVFTPEDATNICNEFGSLGNLGLRTFGLPFYVGHPDHPAFAAKYPDKSAKGRIKQLECRKDDKCDKCSAFVANEDDAEPCRDHGLFAGVKFNDMGRQIVANEEFHGHSVNWAMHRDADGWHPHFLKSVGFTNEPCIPVPAITHANENAMSKLIELAKKHLKKDFANEDDAYGAMEAFCNAQAKISSDLADFNKRHGIANEATFAPLTTAGITLPTENVDAFFVNELTTRASALKAVATADTSALALLEPLGVKPVADQPLVLVVANELLAVEGKRKTAEGRATASELLVANERRETVKTLLDLSVVTGCLTAAERDAELKDGDRDKDFANEGVFKATVTKVAGLKPKLSVFSQVGHLGRTDAEVKAVQESGEKIRQFVNEDMEADAQAGRKPDYTRSFGKAKKHFANEFATMQQPDTSAATPAAKRKTK